MASLVAVFVGLREWSLRRHFSRAPDLGRVGKWESGKYYVIVRFRRPDGRAVSQARRHVVRWRTRHRRQRVPVWALAAEDPRLQNRRSSAKSAEGGVGIELGLLGRQQRRNCKAPALRMVPLGRSLAAPRPGQYIESRSSRPARKRTPSCDGWWDAESLHPHTDRRTAANAERCKAKPAGWDRSTPAGDVNAEAPSLQAATSRPNLE